MTFQGVPIGSDRDRLQSQLWQLLQLFGHILAGSMFGAYSKLTVLSIADALAGAETTGSRRCDVAFGR